MPRSARAALRVPLPAGAPRLAVLQTAYQLLHAAHVLVGTEDGAPFLELHPRAALEALKSEVRLLTPGEGEAVQEKVNGLTRPIDVALVRLDGRTE